MSVASGALQTPVDLILAMLGRSVKSGSLVIHLDDFRVQKIEVHEVFRPRHVVASALVLQEKPVSGL